eukprot:5435434-Amphidinium_carterae.1
MRYRRLVEYTGPFFAQLRKANTNLMQLDTIQYLCNIAVHGKEYIRLAAHLKHTHTAEGMTPMVCENKRWQTT